MPAPVPVLEDLGDLDGRRVLVRADFNVPLDDDGQSLFGGAADEPGNRRAILRTGS